MKTSSNAAGVSWPLPNARQERRTENGRTGGDGVAAMIIITEGEDEGDGCAGQEACGGNA